MQFFRAVVVDRICCVTVEEYLNGYALVQPIDSDGRPDGAAEWVLVDRIDLSGHTQLSQFLPDHD